MAKNLCTKAILGLDFLEQNHCIINTEQKVLHLKGRALALLNTGTADGISTADTKAVLYESLHLPPLSEIEVVVKVKDTVSGDVRLIEAAALLKELPVIVANAVVKPIESNEEITIPIRLINPSADLVSLRKGTTIAHVTKLDPCSMVATVNSETTGPHPDVPPGVTTTEQELLWELVCESGQGLDTQQQDKLHTLLLGFADVFALNDKQLG